MAITDLTGTTWYVPSEWKWEYPNGVELTLNDLTGTLTYLNNAYSFTRLVLGYAMDEGEIYEGWCSIYTNDSWMDCSAMNDLAFTFTGGTDVTNADLISWLTTYGTQLKVTDLTNTTWNVAADWEAESGYGVFSINGYHFLAPNMDFDTIMLGYSDVDFPEANTYFDFPAKMLLPSPAEISITITSGDDVTNPKLIAWLSKWGELQVEEEGEAPPNDLTGYTVTVPAGWSAEIGYGIFTLDFEVNLFVSGTYYGTIPCIYSIGNLRMGYDADGYLADNVLSFRSTISDHSANFQNFTPDPSTPFSFSIRVTGGDDTDDPSLIQWFVDNKATFEKTGGEEEPPEEIVIIPAGTYRFKDVLTPLPFEILNRGYGSGNHDWLLSEYGFDVSPLPFLLKEGDVEATVTISRFSISYLFGDVYVDDKPTVFYDYIVIKAELMGEQATAGFDSFRFAGLQFTIPEDTEAHSITCAWFTANTEPYSKKPTVTYDLSQLNLPAGTHLITVIAKADGYADSAPSNAVEYVVEETVPSDLTGWTVTVPSGWTTDGVSRGFLLDGSISVAGLTGTFRTSDFIIPSSPLNFWLSITEGVSNQVSAYVNEYPNNQSVTIDNSYGFSLELNESIDSSNASLIQWFVDNKATFTQNGEVEEEETVSIKLDGHFLGMTGASSTTYIKFGSAPTSNDDYDYFVSNGGTSIKGKDNYSADNPSVTVSPIAYIWSVGYEGAYEFTTSSVAQPIVVGNSYDNATVVDLSQAKGTENTWTLYLSSWMLD